MKKYSKRFTNLLSLRKKDIYSINEALELLKVFNSKGPKFLESVEAHISLNLDSKTANQPVRSSLVLPHGTGKSVKIAVFANPENHKTIAEMGATKVGHDDLLEEIKQGKIDFDLLITTPELMTKLATVAKILGPKGLMPNPKSGTVTSNLADTISQFKKGKVEYRADKSGIIHLSFGKINFSENELKENLISVFQSVEKNKPSGNKGKYFQSFHICTTMSPSLKIDLTSLA